MSSVVARLNDALSADKVKKLRCRARPFFDGRLFVAANKLMHLSFVVVVIAAV